MGRHFSKVGVIAAILPEGRDELLMGSHKGGPRSLKDHWGPPAKTLHTRLDVVGHVIESPEEALARSFVQELGIPEADLPGLDQLKLLGRFSCEWPVIDAHGRTGPELSEMAFAICYVIDAGLGDWVPWRPETEDISEVRFMDIGAILEFPRGTLRPGVKHFVRALIRELPALPPATKGEPLKLDLAPDLDRGQWGEFALNPPPLSAP